MPLDIMFDGRAEIEQDIWQVIAARCEELNEPLVDQTTWSSILTKPSAYQLGKAFLRHWRHSGRAKILTPEQMFGIALEDRSSGRLQAHSDVDEVAGVYVFVSLSNDTVLKVGQSSNLQTRIAKGHLRHGAGRTTSNLMDRCSGIGWAWPDCLQSKQIAAILFPMQNAAETDLEMIERCLAAVLTPLMP